MDTRMHFRNHESNRRYEFLQISPLPIFPHRPFPWPASFHTRISLIHSENPGSQQYYHLLNPMMYLKSFQNCLTYTTTKIRPTENSGFVWHSSPLPTPDWRGTASSAVSCVILFLQHDDVFIWVICFSFLSIFVDFSPVLTTFNISMLPKAREVSHPPYSIHPLGPPNLF